MSDTDIITSARALIVAVAQMVQAGGAVLWGMPL